jgi:exopolysaccharide biosynthesis polyprenyl glycosylphosphotransferase
MSGIGHRATGRLLLGPALQRPIRRRRAPESPRPASTLPAARAVPESGAAWARKYRAKLFGLDVAVIVAASVGAAFIVNPAAMTGGPGVRRAWVITTLIALIWLAATAVLRTRERRIIGTGAAEYQRMISATILAFGFLAMTFLVAGEVAPRSYFITAAPAGLVGLLTSRWLARKWLTRQRRNGHYLAHAIVVGRRRDVEYVVRQIQQKCDAAYDVIGVALSHPAQRMIQVEGDDIPVVATLDTVAEVAEQCEADVVIVAGNPHGGSDYIRSLGWDLEGTPAELVLASRLTDVAGPRIHFRPVEGLPLMHVELPTYAGFRHIFKRVFDVAVTGAALVVLLPVLALIALLVKLDSPGPALFLQERVGRDGRTFQIWKFRSMAVDAEVRLAELQDANEGAGVLFKLRDDPRVTRIGRVLRKYSLDELPQLWNVLIGDMSLVGPRPPLPGEVEAYERHVQRRLFIKPGLTGMWQVGGRSNLSWEDSVRLDLYYVENWSIAGDLVILWRTARMLLRPVGAY